jgi:hypothetical protein
LPRIAQRGDDAGCLPYWGGWYQGLI